jgi:hypothetical protein
MLLSSIPYCFVYKFPALVHDFRLDSYFFYLVITATICLSILFRNRIVLFFLGFIYVSFSLFLLSFKIFDFVFAFYPFALSVKNQKIKLTEFRATNPIYFFKIAKTCNTKTSLQMGIFQLFFYVPFFVVQCCSSQ